MTDLPREDLLEQLRTLAHQQHRSVDDVLEELLAPYQQQLEDADDEEAPPGTLAALAASGRRAGLRAKVDTSKNSREILHNEYTDHLRERHEIYTPYGNEAAAQILFELLQAADDEAKQDDEQKT